MSNILEFKNITKKYENTLALSSISFNVPKNCIAGLIGANGAGKTTILKTIIRYQNPTNGEVYFNSKNINEYKKEKFPIAFLPDTPIFFDELTVLEHLDFISTMHKTKELVEDLIAILELERHLDKAPANLSKGTKQKLMIACTLLQKFEMLIADEPFTGLDPKQIDVLKILLTNLKNKGKTIMLSTHILSIMEDICDYYIMIDNGVLLASGSLEEISSKIKSNMSINDIYLYLSSQNEDT